MGWYDPGKERKQEIWSVILSRLTPSRLTLVVGPKMMVQQDIVEQRFHSDAVSFGGWSLDLHPADGVFSEVDGCTQWHSKG